MCARGPQVQFLWIHFSLGSRFSAALLPSLPPVTVTVGVDVNCVLLSLSLFLSLPLTLLLRLQDHVGKRHEHLHEHTHTRCENLPPDFSSTRLSTIWMNAICIQMRGKKNSWPDWSQASNLHKVQLSHLGIACYPTILCEIIKNERNIQNNEHVCGGHITRVIIIIIINKYIVKNSFP